MAINALGSNAVSVIRDWIKTWVEDHFVASEDGKGLSTNDYSDEEKAKVADLETAVDGKLDSSLVGVANGVAPLNEEGVISSDLLPSITVDVMTDEEIDDILSQ